MKTISTFVKVIAGSWDGAFAGLQQAGLGRLIFLRRLVHWHLRQGIAVDMLHAVLHWSDQPKNIRSKLQIELVSRGT